MPITRRQCLYRFSAGLAAASPDSLLERWRQIAAETDGTLGAAALYLPSGRNVSLRGGDRFPLASVCKLPIALHILARVDEGKLSWNAPIEVVAADVTQNVSEVGKRWPKQRLFPLDELISSMVAHSDNTAVETLYRIGGGSPAITARLAAWRLDGIRIDRTEKQCGLDADRSMPRFIQDPRDTATPGASVQLLKRLFAGQLLSPPSTARIIEVLKATTTGPARIKGQLPSGTIVAHKTGTTATRGGLNGSTNDLGVVLLPGHAQLALAIYLKGSRQPLAARETILARAAKAAFDAQTA